MNCERMDAMTLTHVGGPTLLLEIGKHRILTDPTFSPPGEYQSGTIVLRKLTGPARSQEEIGAVDVVLVSHDQHADNLDPAGRAYASTAPLVLTTSIGAQRIGPPAVGLEPWSEHVVGDLVVTATPARHGPSGSEAIVGDVVGFIVGTRSEPHLVYLTGDTVYYEGVAEVARRFKPRLVVAFAGAAKTRGPFHLTMDTNDVLDTAAAFANSQIAVIHAEGWAHFTQSYGDVATAFSVLKREGRLVPLTAGRPVRFEPATS